MFVINYQYCDWSGKRTAQTLREALEFCRSLQEGSTYTVSHKITDSWSEIIAYHDTGLVRCPDVADILFMEGLEEL